MLSENVYCWMLNNIMLPACPHTRDMGRDNVEGTLGQYSKPPEPTLPWAGIYGPDQWRARCPSGLIQPKITAPSLKYRLTCSCPDTL